MISQETLPIDALQPGMRLAAAVTDAGGLVLLPAGAELTESMLHGLRRRGAAELLIQTELDEDPAVLEARRAHLEKQLEQLFRQAGKGAETMALYQAILDFRLERGA
jgi:hypothetical protein